jgi:hypothetical protein
MVCWLPVLPWRSAIVAGALGAAGVAAGVAVMGADAWMDWMAITRERRVFPNPANLSLVAALARIAGHPLVSVPGDWPYGQPVWSLLVLAVLAVTWLRGRSGSVDQGLLAFGLAGILVSPIGWAYYLVIVLAPFIAWGEQQRWPRAVLPAVMLLLVPRDAMFWLSEHGFGWAGASLGGFGALLLWAAAVRTPARVGLEPVAEERAPALDSPRPEVAHAGS